MCRNAASMRLLLFDRIIRVFKGLRWWAPLFWSCLKKKKSYSSRFVLYLNSDWRREKNNMLPVEKPFFNSVVYNSLGARLHVFYSHRSFFHSIRPWFSEFLQFSCIEKDQKTAGCGQRCNRLQTLCFLCINFLPVGDRWCVCSKGPLNIHG